MDVGSESAVQADEIVRFAKNWRGHDTRLASALARLQRGLKADALPVSSPPVPRTVYATMSTEG